MRLGELSEDQQARGHEERHSPTWIWPILSLVFATSGLGALLVKSTPVICTSTGERACIERIADADWLMPPGLRSMPIPTALLHRRFQSLTKWI